jgi:hypothetical protein
MTIFLKSKVFKNPTALHFSHSLLVLYSSVVKSFAKILMQLQRKERYVSDQVSSMLRIQEETELSFQHHTVSSFGKLICNIIINRYHQFVS